MSSVNDSNSADSVLLLSHLPHFTSHISHPTSSTTTSSTILQLHQRCDGNMRKLFSVICSIFVLYSAFVIESSRAALNCQFSHNDPSFISAGMFDNSGEDRGNDMVEIKVEAPKTVGSSFDFQSCHLLANATSGEFDKKENTLLVPMKRYDPSSPTLVKFSGQGRLPMNIGTIGAFAVYCPLDGTDIETAKFSMKMDVWVHVDKFTHTSDTCKVIRHDRFAESVKVYSPLNSSENFSVEIKNIVEPFVKGSDFVISKIYSTHPVTLGTYNDYSLSKIVNCLVDGQQGLAYAFGRNYYPDIEIVFMDTPAPKTTHIIECPSVIAKIISGNQYVPSIIKVMDYEEKQVTLATNIYLF